MNGPRRLACLLVICAVGVVGSNVSGAQLGGLIKKKIGEATKKDDPKRDAPAPTTPAVSNELNFPFPDISESILVALQRGLETEIALRDDFKKELAAIKTPEQYNGCKLQSIQSPEYRAIAERLANVPDNAKPEETRKVMMEVGLAGEALTLKTCGPDPAQFNGGWRAERLTEIHRKAAAAAVVPR